MGRSSDITLVQKSRILVYQKETGYNQREIARKVGVSASTVNRVIKNYAGKKTEPPSNRQNCGRKRKTSERFDRKIVKTAIMNRSMTINEIKKSVENSHTSISKMTIRRRLYENNIRARRPAIKPRLNARMMKQRLQWAMKYRKYTVEDWKRVCTFLCNATAKI